MGDISKKWGLNTLTPIHSVIVSLKFLFISKYTVGSKVNFLGLPCKQTLEARLLVFSTVALIPSSNFLETPSGVSSRSK